MNAYFHPLFICRGIHLLLFAMCVKLLISILWQYSFSNSVSRVLGSGLQLTHAALLTQILQQTTNKQDR